MRSKSVNPETNAKLVVPLRTRVALSLVSTLSDAARRPDGTINRRLLSLVDLKSSPSPTKPVRSVVSSDTLLDTSRNLWFRLYVPTHTQPTTTSSFGCCATTTARPSPDHQNQTTNYNNKLLPVMIFFHGGGFSFLSAASYSYDIVCGRFARRLPALVVSVNYRLTPEHRFPSQYDDGFDVLKYLDQHHPDVLPPNADLSRCFLAGDSAGANLAHHVAIRASRSQFRAVKVVGLISIQPFFGGEERTESEIRLADSFLVSVPRTDWCWKAFLPEGSNRDHYAVNVSGPNAAEISGVNYPKTLVFVGGFDPLQDWQRRYFEWLRKWGKEVTLIEYPAMFHAFYIFPELTESSQLISQVKDFVVNMLVPTPDPN